MTMRRAAPGPQLAAGRLRVDAARAIAKLREYQLADRSAWILEAIRAAVASGASRIELRGDANDIWLAWHGPAWDAARLPRLFDELVSPEPVAELQHVRLLAAAVNSALGMNPAYVDVYTIEGSTPARRVRYTPDVLDLPETELGDAPLREITIEAAQPPLPVTTGMLVHLRRRASLEVLGYLFGEPPELPMAREHCQDIAVPLTIGEQVLQRTNQRDVLRVPLGDGLDGFVAVSRHAGPTYLEVAERGVVLARYSIDLLGFSPRGPVPLRVFVDAERLPTNASRSQVRRDVHPISSAERRAEQLVERAIAELAKLAGSGDVHARCAALQLLAASVAGHPAGWRDVALVLAPLATLPLVRNAVGEPRPITTQWRDPVHTGKSALDADLAEWLGEVVWLRGDDPAAVLLGDWPIDKHAMRQLARLAREQRRAHRRFLAHAKRELRVQTSVTPRLRVAIGAAVTGSCVPDARFADARGELCVYANDRDAALVVVLDGRELERIELTTEVAFDAVIESNAVRPAERYDGVARDAGLATVTLAMWASVVRAVESMCAANDVQSEADMRLIRETLVIADQTVKCELDGPLVTAPAWLDVTGVRVSFTDVRSRRYVGIVAPGTMLRAPAGRLVVEANEREAAQLRQLLPGNRVIGYQRVAGRQARVTSAQLAMALSRSARTASLCVRDGDLVGAIAIAHKSSLRLVHMAVALPPHAYAHQLAPCSIAVDSDAIAPNEQWSGALDDAGLLNRSYREWELALLRAIARAILGDQPAELDAPDRITLDDSNGAALSAALLAHDPVEVLGAELLARFKQVPLFAVLGSARLHSIDMLAATFADTIPYVGWDTQQIDDYAPLVAREATARLVARLAGRDVCDGTPELERRRRRALFDARYAAHVAAPAYPLQLTGETHAVPVTGRIANGVAGVSSGAFEIRVHVSGRPFSVVRPRVTYPLIAVVEIQPERCDETFDGLPDDTVEAITREVTAAIPALLARIATHAPVQLGSPSPARTLLATWLAHATPSDELRETLRAAPAFATVQGQHMSIAEAAAPQLFLSTATWADTWLAPGEGEPQNALDEPILAVSGASDELHAIFDQLHPHGVGDVTADIGRLQARRRMARGLLPTPKLGEVAAAYKRELRTFGALADKLGHGEIGLVVVPQSSVLVHVHGQLQRSVDVDVLPAIQLAVEDPYEHYPSHDALRNVAQQLALELVREVAGASAELPIAFRRNLARAALANRVPPAAIANQPLFLCSDGTWLDWAGFASQLTTFDNVWAVTSPPLDGARPLDPDRIVVVLDASDIELASTHGHAVINAKLELELDAKARANRARPRVRSLGLSSTTGILAKVPLEGDGQTAPRGVVAVLAPDASHQRGIYVHRDLQLLGRIDDVCRWPTVAVVDDARIVPDRTWSAPKKDETWQAIAKQLRTASEVALGTLGDVPEHALASRKVNNHFSSGVAALRDAPRAAIRGALWLTAVPYTRATIAVHDRGCVRTYTPERGLAIGGWLAVFDPDAKLVVDTALAQLCKLAHGKLVRSLLKSDYFDRDVVAAHVAHAIALGTVRPTEVSGVELTCFAPNKLTPRALAKLLRATDPVPRVRAGSDIEGFVDDGSELAKVVRVHLGERLFEGPVTKPASVSPKATPPPPLAKPPVSTHRPAPPAPRRKPPPPHPLRGVVDALAARVGQLGIPAAYPWVIDDVHEPLVDHDRGQIVVAGDNPTLRAVAGELAANSIRAAPAIDALAAHVVSVLNLALTEITDATETHALGVLLATRRSAGRRRSRRSS